MLIWASLRKQAVDGLKGDMAVKETSVRDSLDLSARSRCRTALFPLLPRDATQRPVGCFSSTRDDRCKDVEVSPGDYVSLASESVRVFVTWEEDYEWRVFKPGKYGSNKEIDS